MTTRADARKDEQWIEESSAKALSHSVYCRPSPAGSRKNSDQSREEAA
jgi:hypothetical protein